MFQNFEDEENHYLLLEYCDGVELFQELKKHKTIHNYGFDEDSVSLYFRRIAKGV